MVTEVLQTRGHDTGEEFPATCWSAYFTADLNSSITKEKATSALTSDRPFIQPAGLVNQTSSSQSFTFASEMPVAQLTGLGIQFTASQPPAGTSKKGLSTTSVTVDVHQNSITGSGEMLVLQPVRLAN